MLEKVQADRLAKLEQIRALGIDPCGGRYDTAEAIKDVLAKYAQWEASHGGAEAVKAAPAVGTGLKPVPPVVAGPERIRADAAGRLILLRDMGKMIFAHIRDESGQMQIALRKNALDEKAWALAKLLDLGDIIAVEGTLERTRTGEVTVWAERLTLLCKALLPMPEKFHGLVDTETRYRRRYLDLMTNPGSLAVFRKRIEIIEHFRAVLKRRGFVEVETPILQPIYGGGAARPFTTHHNTLDADLFLRISPELYLKRLLVGGMEKVFEIGRQFRNEGLSTRHNPEFTMMELYQAYADYEVMMEITEELIAATVEQVGRNEMEYCREISKAKSFDEQVAVAEKYRGSEAARDLRSLGPTSAPREKTPEQHVIQEALSDNVFKRTGRLVAKGRVALPYRDVAMDYTRPWVRRTYDELLQGHAGVSMRDPAAVRAKARELHIEEAGKDDAVVVNEVFEATVVPALAKPDANGVVRPVFVKDYPADICPLTRRKADDPTIALRFELFIAGMEIANAYTELNDPAVQEANFHQQLRGEGDNAGMRVLDEDFLLALRHGMPPAGGLGIGIDRVVMLLTNSTSIRDVVLFPLLRPEKNS